MKMFILRLLLAVALVVPAFALPVPEVIYSWALEPTSPFGLIQGSDGNFYGVSSGGGAGLGTIFKVTPTGAVTTLVEFTGDGATNKGFYPNGGLIQASDGNFYGTTGGYAGVSFGTVFKMTPAGQLTTLVEFTVAGIATNGIRPMAGLVEGSDGNLYGTTGGTPPPQTAGSGWINAPLIYSPPDNGTVFKMTPAGVLTTLVHFSSNGATNKGANPRAALIQGSDGDFYGTTNWGAANNQGTIFKVTSTGVLTTLAEISGGNGTFHEGASELIQGSDGNFYGTIIDAGANGWGTVFRLTPGGTFSTLVEFTKNGAANKGYWPRGGLLKGSDGNLYGTTTWGGALDCGTVFKMTPSGALTTLLEFTGNAGPNKGAIPGGNLTAGSDGSLYGTTSAGGAGSHGTIFKMTPAGALTTLAEQYIARRGANPVAGLVQGSDGDFYGTTQAGGVENYGTVFKITSAGVQTTLSSFVPIGTPGDGQTPVAGLVQGADGSFYGSTQDAGTLGYGTVFKITPAGVRTTLVNFTSTGATNRGANPQSELVLGTDGDFYGMTIAGGASGFGTVFKMTPGGVLTTLVEFTGNGAANKGSFPQRGLVQGSHGEFYGTTSSGGSGNNGTIFKMTPDGALTTLFEFPQVGQYGIGAVPTGTLAQGSDGNFYGTTQYGGAAGYGTVFRMTPAGAVTTLAEFSGSGATNTGANPMNGVVLGSDGNFYGTTSAGGAEGLGTIFMMTPDGTLTTLMNLTHGPNQAKAQAYRLVQGIDGNLYGTISGGYSGGSLVGAGSVYRLAPVGTPMRRAVTAGGSSSAGGSVSGGGGYYNGAQVTLTAQPNTGYGFTYWADRSGLSVSTSATYSFTAVTDSTLVANFGPLIYPVATASWPPAGGSTSGAATVSPGSTITVTATPSPGYTFVNWTEGGSQLSTASAYSFTANASHALVANFTAAGSPTIAITGLPAYGSAGNMTGTVSGVTPSAYKVAAYIYIDGAGWWTKPSFAAPTVPINADGTFTVPLTNPGGSDNVAMIFCAALIPAANTPQQAAAAMRVPNDPNFAAITYQQRYGRTITFAGRQWAVKKSLSPVGPSVPSAAINNFSDQASDVWVDGAGLHLTIHNIGGVWYSTEVILEENLGHGTYAFMTNSRTDTMDPNAVLGMFTWDPYGDDAGLPAWPFREIDIEDSRWRNSTGPNTQYVVQPYSVSGNLVSGTLPNLASNAALTRVFNWQPGYADFVTLAGFQIPSVYLTAPPDLTYSTNAALSHYVPGSGRENIHLNLWLNNLTAPAAPSSNQPVEVVITDFQFTPLFPVTITPSAAPAAGGSVSGGGAVNSGSSVTLVAAPNAGYGFVNWTENGTAVSTSASYSFAATANRTLVANFRVLNPGWVASTQFGSLWNTDQGDGWYYSGVYGWMWFQPSGQWVYSSSLQGWLAVTNAGSATVWSQQFNWLTTSGGGNTAYSSAIGSIYIGTYNGAAISAGWVVSDRFGYVWAAGDGVWYYSTNYGWLGVSGGGGIWSVNQGRFL